MIILSISITVLSSIVSTLIGGIIVNLIVSILPNLISKFLPQKIRDNASKIFKYVKNGLENIVNSIGFILNKIASNPVLTSLVVLVICFSIIFSFTIIKNSEGVPYYSYNDSFIENILVESHGMLLDIIVFGIIITIIELFRGKNQEIKRYNEEIEDFREWDEKEAKHRIGGNLKRLQGLGETKIDLTDCYLENFKHNDLKLVKSKMNRVNFIGSKLKNATFNNCELRNARFRGAELLNAKFNNSVLFGADFKDTELFGTEFINTTLNNVDFRGAKFKRIYSTKPTFTKEEIEKPEKFDYITVRIVDFSGAKMEGVKALKKDKEILKECNADISSIVFEN